jgi:U2-associated protein SR140
MSDKGAADVSSKLNAPKKVSIFEKQRQEAEAKRLREEAENRAALREFEDSFADNDNQDDLFAQAAAGRNASSSSSGYTRGAPMRNSGPGTLGPPTTAPTTTTSLKRKRELEQRRERTQERASSQQRHDSTRTNSPEAVVKRPTVLLSSLPRNSTESTVRALMPNTLRVDHVVFAPSSSGQPLTAVVALSPDTASSDIDSAINALQQKYLGFGSYLNISKHITISSRLSAALHTATSTTTAHPFGARPMPREPMPTHSFRNAPPPDSLPPHIRHQGPAPLVVNVNPPSDLKQLATINKTVEKLITYGPEWECLLMSQPDVQHGEHWAWLFDNTSQGHVWYRWLIYQYYASRPPACESPHIHPWSLLDEVARANRHCRLFDQGPAWVAPVEKPLYEYAQTLTDLMSDSGYVSSDLDTDDEDDHIIQTQGVGPEDVSVSRPRYLNPYRKAKLTFFLNHLPDSTGYLCQGDVQAVTDLVIKFSAQGAEEVVDMLVSNVENPFRLSVDYKIDRIANNDEDVEHDNDNYDPELDGPRASFGMLGGTENVDTEDVDQPDDAHVQTDQSDKTKVSKDISGAQLVGLYIISDALAATSVSGVRDAWKYRSLFETSLTARQVFEQLGRMPKLHSWGRVRAEQWKSRICVVLECWERESIFAPESHRRFKQVVLNPPLIGEERRVMEERERADQEEELKKKWKDDAPASPLSVAIEESVPEDQQQPIKRQPTRPSAADLILATADGETPPPKPAPKLSNFSMSLNKAVSASLASQAEDAVQSSGSKMGFSLGGRVDLAGGTLLRSNKEDAGKQPLQQKKKGDGLDVFGDSDSE